MKSYSSDPRISELSHSKKSTDNLKDEEIKSNGLTDILDRKYNDLFLSTNLNGKYQKGQFIVMALVCFVSSLMLFMLSLQKQLPKLYCFNKNEFTSDVEYNIYKNKPNLYQIITNSRR